MTKIEFLDFATAAATRAAQFLNLSKRSVGSRVFLQSPNIGKELTLREPEIGIAFALQAEAQGNYYGVEWPTEETYKLTGRVLTPPRKALTDFVLLTQQNAKINTDVLVEFKTLQNDTMEKDFLKLIREEAGTGRCMFHVLHGANRGSLPALEKKYNLACQAEMKNKQSAGRRITERDDDTPWYVLFVMVLYHRGKTWQGSRCRLYEYRWDINLDIWRQVSDNPIN